MSVNIDSLRDTIHLGGPNYGERSRGRGTSMEVLLGPWAGNTLTGTTNACGINGVMRGFHERDPGKWIAAHLLNAWLGGRGDDAQNLAPMTQTANKNHSRLEDKVKNLCVVARQQMEQGNAESHCYAVLYKVEASMDAFRDYAPYDSAPHRLTVSVAIFKRPWTPPNRRVPGSGWGGEWSEIAQDDRLLQCFRPFFFLPTVVPNEDHHIVNDEASSQEEEEKKSH